MAYPPGFITSHTHTFNPIDPATFSWTNAIESLSKEPPMTTLDKVRAERAEARERLRIEQMYNDYDEQSLETTEDGDVVRFTWNPDDRPHPYTYAALYVARKWYVTGGQAPNGLATEDFVAWLIGKGIAVDDLVWLDARP